MNVNDDRFAVDLRYVSFVVLHIGFLAAMRKRQLVEYLDQPVETYGLRWSLQ